MIYTYPPAGSGSRSRAWSDVFWLPLSDDRGSNSDLKVGQRTCLNLQNVKFLSFTVLRRERGRRLTDLIHENGKTTREAAVRWGHGFAQRKTVWPNSRERLMKAKFLCVTDLVRRWQSDTIHGKDSWRQKFHVGSQFRLGLQWIDRSVKEAVGGTHNYF